MSTPISDTPRWKPSIREVNCAFLGQYAFRDKDYDLYYRECTSFPLIARFGDARCDYIQSSNSSSLIGVMEEARRRAVAAGHLRATQLDIERNIQRLLSLQNNRLRAKNEELRKALNLADVTIRAHCAIIGKTSDTDETLRIIKAALSKDGEE